MQIPIICHGCGATGSVSRVTANLQCRCGSTDLDINDIEKTAAPHGPGTGWDETRPNVLEDWNEYIGPGIAPNPLAHEHLVGDADAYDGTNYRRGNPDYIPGGGYEVNTWPTGPTTSQPEVESWDKKKGPASGGARWQGREGSFRPVPVQVTYADGSTWTAAGFTQTAGRPSKDVLGSPEEYISPTTPGYGGRDESDKNWSASPMTRNRPDHDYSHGDKPLQLNQATCPNCRHVPTQIVRDKNDQGWWNCPSCGPLANIDKNPHINPNDPPFGFTPDRSMKRKSKLAFASKKTGKLVDMMENILQTNSGLSVEASLRLSREALLKYSEDDE